MIFINNKLFIDNFLTKGVILAWDNFRHQSFYFTTDMPLRKMYFFRTKYLFPILICDIALLSQFITYLIFELRVKYFENHVSWIWIPVGWNVLTYYSGSHSHPESGYNLTWKCVLFVFLSPSLVCSISITRLVIIINTNSNAVYIILCCYFCSYKKDKVTKFSFDCGTTYFSIGYKRKERSGTNTRGYSKVFTVKKLNLQVVSPNRWQNGSF